MERTAVAVVGALDAGWADVGSCQAFADLGERDEPGRERRRCRFVGSISASGSESRSASVYSGSIHRRRAPRTSGRSDSARWQRSRSRGSCLREASTLSTPRSIRGAVSGGRWRTSGFTAAGRRASCWSRSIVPCRTTARERTRYGNCTSRTGRCTSAREIVRPAERATDTLDHVAHCKKPLPVRCRPDLSCTADSDRQVPLQGRADRTFDRLTTFRAGMITCARATCLRA